jgi:hypothetical protein
MTAGHCKDCKHWKAWTSEPDTHECLAIPSESYGGDKPGVKAMMTYYSHLVTLPDFGCVLFEAKE